MRPFLSLLAACAVALAAGAAPRSSEAAPIAVFLVRHAEKAAHPPDDPALSEAGRARADALASLLRDAGVTHLFASEYARTRQTLEPLSKRFGAEVAVLAAARRDELVAKLRDLPAGSVAVVAGHSNTIPALVRSLGGTIARTVRGAGGEMLPDDEYGRVVLLLLPAGAASGAAPLATLELHAGA